MSSKLLSHRPALCNVVRRIAKEAGEIILPYFDGLKEIEVKSKTDGSPVTMADRDAEKHIEDSLLKMFPEIPVIGEESAADGRHAKFQGSEYFWLVDPLDGTRAFIKGEDDFTVNIALIHMESPVLGVVYAPARGELYAGFTGEDELRFAVKYIEENDKDKDIRTRKPPFAGLTVMSSAHFSEGGRMDKFLSEFKVEKIIKRASSLKICAVAAGKADMYPRLGPTGEWDTAAGDAILRAAGGMIKDFETREPLRYGRLGTDFLNPEFVAASADVF